METHKIAALLKAIDLRSITKASEELGYTQSGVSHMVKSLENELGFPLLVRGKAGVEPTEDCSKLLPAMREISRWVADLEETADDIKGVLCGRVRIGAYTSLSVNWLPSIIKAFQERYPRVEIEVVETGGQTLPAELDCGGVDVGFGCIPPDGREGWSPLLEDELMVVAPPDMSIKDSVPVHGFHRAPFVSPVQLFDSEVAGVFEAHGVEPVVKFSSTDDYTIISMVEQGLGMSILPRLVLQGYSHCNVRTAPLEPRCMRELGIALPLGRALSPAVRKFVECAESIVRSSKGSRQ